MVLIPHEDKSLIPSGRYNSFRRAQFSEEILEKFGQNISERFGVRRGLSPFNPTDPKAKSIASDKFAKAANHQTLGELRTYLHLSHHECVPKAHALWIDKDGHLNILMEKYTYLLHQLVDVRSKGNMPDESHMVAIYHLLQSVHKAGVFLDDPALDNIMRDEDNRFRFLDPGEINLYAETIDSSLSYKPLSKINMKKEARVPEQFIPIEYPPEGKKITCDFVDGRLVIRHEDIGLEPTRDEALERELQDTIFSLLEFKFGDVWRRAVITNLEIPIPPRDGIRTQQWKGVCNLKQVDFEAYRARHPHHTFFKSSAKENKDESSYHPSALLEEESSPRPQ